MALLEISFCKLDENICQKHMQWSHSEILFPGIFKVHGEILENFPQIVSDIKEKDGYHQMEQQSGKNPINM